MFAFVKTIPWLFCLTMNLPAENAPEKSLLDLRVSTNLAAQVVNDDVMGGVSTSRCEVTTNGTMVFQGEVSLENNGGFASVRFRPLTRDLGEVGRFVLRVRGDGKRYKFVVRTESGLDGVNYQSTFATTTGAWQRVELSLSEFAPTFRGRVLSDVPPLDPAKIESVGFLISDKQAGRFALEIESIKAAGKADGRGKPTGQ